MKSSRRFVVILPLLLAALNLPALALEGYYTEEEVRTPAPGEPGDWTYIRKSWYSDQRMRKEEEWLGITIARFDKDLIYVLEPTIKTYFEVTPETLRKHAESQLKLFGAQEDAQGKPYFPADLFVRTGTTKKIGRWSAYQVMTNPKYRRPEIPYMVIWYSTEINFPVKLFGDQLRNFFGNSPEAEGLFQRLTQFAGYPVRTESYSGSGFTITTLAKIERRTDINPALYEIPEDYVKTPLPEEVPVPLNRP